MRLRGIRHRYVQVNIASEYALLSSYPNPFNPSTRIDYSLPEAGLVTVGVYNMLGQQVTRLVNEHLAGGSYSVIWNGTNGSGNDVPSGIYMVKMDHVGGSMTQKVTLLK